jgi:IS30 family transposase
LERGSNENENGLIPQYFPKDRDLSIVQRAVLEEVMARLNNRPRKILGFRAPLDVFSKGLHPPGGRALGS